MRFYLLLSNSYVDTVCSLDQSVFFLFYFFILTQVLVFALGIGLAMRIWRFVHFICLSLLFLQSKTCLGGVRSVGKIYPGYQGSQMNWIDNNGLFLLSKNSQFAFGFTTTSQDVTLFLLVVMHLGSLKVVWSANASSPVANSDKFVFDDKGKVFLQKGSHVVWSLDSGGKAVSAIELQNSGNLVLLGDRNEKIWQSFSHPTDTLLTNQEFVEGMKLVSSPGSRNLSYVLEIKSGDVVLSAGYQIPQPYWSMGKEPRKIINKDGGVVRLATLVANSWNLYDKNKVLLWQFIFSDNIDGNSTWIAVLGNDGFLSFYNLGNDQSSNPSSTSIPSDSCSTPAHCDPYYECFSDNKCQCPSGLLNSYPNCGAGIVSPCGSPKGANELVNAGDEIYYFALGFVPPFSKTDLESCKNSCLGNCSCHAVFFENSTGSCFLFDRVGNFQNSNKGSGFVSFIKISNDERSSKKPSESKHFPYVVVIVLSTLFVICVLLYGGWRYYKQNKKLVGSPCETSEEDNFLEGLSGMLVRFRYRDLQSATNNFSVKLGQGGFGSVYQGVLPDGTRLAVKKLEGINQGKKEFQAEVSIIGSIHHHHLVRLKGFCAEGNHRLLAYEFMANGSLDKWIFKKDKEFLLDWDTRYQIAIGTAKGLAYLHEDCDQKIVHCDMKPENVLLDNNFLAKVSDFGLAKLMTREQSHVFTTLRGTRGYLAPEWITNYAISEKSDVYSYGMMLLEIIGGRKNYDPGQISEKSHFPTYALKMLEEGRVQEILDSRLHIDETYEKVSIAIKVALWCIQEDMSLRPPMSKVAQMLEGLCVVPPPPSSAALGSRLFSGIFKSSSEEGTSSGPSDCNNDTYISAVHLSGPR